jgi:hypothetical protein
MTDSDYSAPDSGFVVTHFLVVADQDRSRGFYQSVFGATVVVERADRGRPDDRTAEPVVRPA